MLSHGLAQGEDAYTEQFLFHLGGRLAFVDDPQFPGIEQLGVGQG